MRGHGRTAAVGPPMQARRSRSRSSTGARRCGTRRTTRAGEWPAGCPRSTSPCARRHHGCERPAPRCSGSHRGDPAGLARARWPHRSACTAHRVAEQLRPPRSATRTCPPAGRGSRTLARQRPSRRLPRRLDQRHAVEDGAFPVELRLDDGATGEGLGEVGLDRPEVPERGAHDLRPTRSCREDLDADGVGRLHDVGPVGDRAAVARLVAGSTHERDQQAAAVGGGPGPCPATQAHRLPVPIFAGRDVVAVR